MRLNPHQRYLQSITVTVRSSIQAGETGETREKSYGLPFLPFLLRMTSNQCDSERRGLLGDAFDQQRAPFNGNHCHAAIVHPSRRNWRNEKKTFYGLPFLLPMTSSQCDSERR